jgi:hypothetical protein
MSFGAVATVVGAGLSAYGASRALSAQKGANKEQASLDRERTQMEAALQREQLAEQQRQFNIQQPEDTRRFDVTTQEGMRQFNIAQNEAARKYDTQRADEIARLGATQGLLSPFISQGLPAYQGLGAYGEAGKGALGSLGQYGQAGLGALGAQQGLLGLSGDAAQQAAIAGISGGPEMQAMVQQGENAMLQNASATGGLRGGNMQAALSQFRPQILNQLIAQRLSQYGGLAAAGQSALGQLSNLGADAYGNIAQMSSQLAATPGAAGAQRLSCGQRIRCQPTRCR